MRTLGKILSRAALPNEGKTEAAEGAGERYRQQLDRALARAEEARAEGRDTDEVLAHVSEARRAQSQGRTGPGDAGQPPTSGGS